MCIAAVAVSVTVISYWKLPITIGPFSLGCIVHKLDTRYRLSTEDDLHFCDVRGRYYAVKNKRCRSAETWARTKRGEGPAVEIYARSHGRGVRTRPCVLGKAGEAHPGGLDLTGYRYGTWEVRGPCPVVGHYTIMASSIRAGGGVSAGWDREITELN